MAETTIFESKIKILYIHHSDRNKKRWLHIKHSHPFAEIFYIINGKGKFFIGNDTVFAQKNDIFYIQEGIEHAELSDDNDPLEYLVIGISGISFLSSAGYALPYFQFADTANELQFYFSKGHEEYTAALENGEEIVQNLIQILLILLMRKQKFSIESNDKTHARQDSILIKNYIDINFREDIQLDDLAMQFHISKYQIAHLFKKDYAISPIRYLNLLRLENVNFLLISTNYSILEIAISSGFKSQSYLTQFFKNELGQSPLQYRKENKL